MCSLLFAFLDACITAFHCDDSFIARDMRVVELRTPVEGLADGTVKHQKPEGGPGDDEAVFIDSEDPDKSPASDAPPSSSAPAADSGFYIKVAA